MKSFHFGPHQGHLAFALQSDPYYAQEHFHVGPQSSKSASDLFATANRRDRTRVTCLQRCCPRTDGDDFCRASLDLWLGPAWLLLCQGRTWQSTRNKWMLLGLQRLITTVRSVRDAAFISIIWAGDEVQLYCSLMKKWKKKKGKKIKGWSRDGHSTASFVLAAQPPSENPRRKTDDVR